MREATWMPGTFDSALMISSVIPSLKYSFSGSALMLASGSTAIAVTFFFLALPSLDSSALQSARNCWPWRSSAQPSRSIVWTARKSSGRRAPSRRTGTSAPRSAASRASPRTQRESTDCGVQTTMMARASESSLVMRLSNSSPGAISGSHQMDHPSDSSAATNGWTRALSCREYETKMSAK